MNSRTLSIDWEDFGQLGGLYHGHGLTAPVGGAIERQTEIILDMLDEAGVKATFFVLGVLAGDRPELVRIIHKRGHEIGLHGHRHVLMSKLPREQAREDLKTSYKLVTDIIGEKVHGYRAPFFSIDAANLHMLDAMAEIGLTYDSSIFPKKMSRYGSEGFEQEDRLYELPEGGELVELPLTVSRYLGRTWPVSGGGYIRLMPRFLVNRVFRDLSGSGKPAMIYMHPYEFDSSPIDIAANYPATARRSTARVAYLNFRWNLFRRSVPRKIAGLLKEHKFITCLERANHVKEHGVRSKLPVCAE